MNVFLILITVDKTPLVRIHQDVSLALVTLVTQEMPCLVLVSYLTR